MVIALIDENKVRELPDEQRFAICEKTLKTDNDESKRWDAVWLAGELAENKNENDSMFQKVSELMEYVLKNDDNGVVIHEACFQIAARNMRNKIPALADTGVYHTSVLAKHEAIEALGLMRAFEAESLIKKALDDPSVDVRETAQFVLKRFARLYNQGEYKPYNIL
jgi:HEAT repeat protein